MSDTMEISTDDDLKYVFNPVTNGFIAFKVRASNDAHIALTSGHGVSDPIVEVFIGGWGNKKSAIRRNRQSDKMNIDTPDILSRCHFKGFWIRWTGGEISVGKEGEGIPFMTWTDPEPFHIRYFGVCTGWGATGSWNIENVKGGRCGRKEICTGNDLKYNFYPVTSGSVTFKVQATNDAHIGLTRGPNLSDPITEVFIGGWENTKSAIRRNREKPDKTSVDTPSILNGVEYRGFWIRWNGGELIVGREGEENHFMSWNDPDPFHIGFFGICTGHGSTGIWKIPKVLPDDYEYDLATGNDLKYVFYPITADGIISFKVRAPNDAHIALTTSPGVSNPITEIYIGGWRNTKSAIRRNRQEPDQASAQTPGILNSDEYRGFWIKCNENYILVGKEGEDDPFLSWNDPQPFKVEYFGVCTGWCATGRWIFQNEEGSINIR